jgi:hypothetical protein
LHDLNPSGRSCIQAVKAGIKGDLTIRRPMNGQMPPKDDGPRVNDAITNATVLVIDDEGEKRGVMKLEAALELALRPGLTL